MQQIRINRPEDTNMLQYFVGETTTNTEEDAALQLNRSRVSNGVRSLHTGNTSETDRDLLWSLEDVFLPTEHGKSLMSRALTPRLLTI